jgi:ribose transport system ATP-binding protein
VGANGSGKSTLVKILSGVHDATHFDRLEVGGRALAEFEDVHEAGIRVVHQDLGLVPELSILENIALGSSYFSSKVGTIKWSETRRMAAQALELVGLSRDLDTHVSALAAWERVAVAASAALAGRLDTVKLLLLDEVTAALPREEVIRIMGIVRRLAGSGVGVLYITHRFEEVFEIAVSYTVLRDGQVLESGEVAEINEDHLIDLVTGESKDTVQKSIRSTAEIRDTRVTCRSLSGPRLKDVSFEIRAGEVLAFTGRVGCGKSALGRALFGIESLTSGELLLDGSAIGGMSPSELIRLGVGYVSEDRSGSGILTGGSVLENLTGLIFKKFSRRFGIIKSRTEEKLANEMVVTYDIRPPDIHMPIDSLSGGNQQKVVIARWLQASPRLLVLDEPTEGVDAGARGDIYELIRRETATGTSVVLLSSSLEEIAELADRVMVMEEGSIERELIADSISVEEIEKLLLMSNINSKYQGAK